MKYEDAEKERNELNMRIVNLETTLKVCNILI